MRNRFKEPPKFTFEGVACALVLLLSLAMAASLLDGLPFGTARVPALAGVTAAGPVS